MECSNGIRTDGPHGTLSPRHGHGIVSGSKSQYLWIYPLPINDEALQRNRKRSSCLICQGSSSTYWQIQKRPMNKEYRVKSTIPENGEDENEATEANLSGKKEDETGSK
jgi:hypothetical protein